MTNIMDQLLDPLAHPPLPTASAHQAAYPSEPKAYPFVPSPPAQVDGIRNEDVVQGLRVALGAEGQQGGWGRAQVWGRDDDDFKFSSMIFNGAVKTHAIALVKPRDAEDVSKTIRFCRSHSLEVSVKAGGNGVHGWSVAGHVILDLSLLNDVTIAAPTAAPTLQESFEKLSLDRRASASIATSSTKRPSLASTHGSKRSAGQFFADGDGDNDGESSGGKRRLETHHEGEGSGGRRSGSGSASSSDNGRRSGSARSTDGSASGTGSGSGSGSGSGRGSTSTASTSLQSTDGKFRGLGLGSDGMSAPLTSPPTSYADNSPGSVSASTPQAATPPVGARTTYVNPTQTSTNSYPFVSTSFGSASSYVDTATGRLPLNSHPDPPPYTLVTFGAGTHSKQLDAATARSQFGAFHVPTSAFPVGAGQFLTGGFGFIGRKHGLAMDNVVEVEMVLADGRIVWVGEGGKHGGEWKDEENPEEVWWGLRGAGPILGVVTRFRAKGYYLPSVFAGNLIYMFDRTSTPFLMRHVRDCIKGSPRTLYANIIMTAGPPGAPAIVVIQLCFSGSRSEGDMYVQAISSWDGGRCLFQDFSERTFERQQVAVEEILRGGKGRKWFIKSDILLSLTDEVIDQTCLRFHVVPDGCTWLFEYTGGGACADTKDTCFPSSHRNASFTVAALHQWSHTEPPLLDTRCVTTAEEWINEVIHPNSPGGPLPCFLQSSTLEAVKGVYGENFDRLAALKRTMDPGNFFKHAMWPRPGAPDDRRQLGEDARDLPSVDDVSDKGKEREREREVLVSAQPPVESGAIETARASMGGGQRGGAGRVDPVSVGPGRSTR